MKYNIGDRVWYATFVPMELVWRECPICAGHGRVTVIMGKGEYAPIDCTFCAPGFNSPTGEVSHYEPVARADHTSVKGIDITADGEVYHLAKHYRADISRIFQLESSALAKAELLASEYREQEAAKLKEKEKPDRSWAWHVGYHRRAIKDAQRQIDYHTAKLNVASLKAKK